MEMYTGNYNGEMKYMFFWFKIYFILFNKKKGKEKKKEKDIKMINMKKGKRERKR